MELLCIRVLDLLSARGRRGRLARDAAMDFKGTLWERQTQELAESAGEKGRARDAHAARLTRCAQPARSGGLAQVVSPELVRRRKC